MDVGLRELRQNASDLVRRAEAGEIVTITVSRRAAAELVPVRRRRWRTYAEVAELFAGSDDGDWRVDRDVLDASPVDPWERRA